MERSSSQRGFALLITITLLAFLVLLLVSLASLTRVETQVADNSQKLNQARQQALMAANLALGQLQRYAGIDRVTTARAEITSSAALPQPYLTGLWLDTNVTTTPNIWLASGNDSPASPLALTPANAPDPAAGTYPVDDAGNTVFLLGNQSVDTPSERVRLAKQPVNAPAGSVPGLASGSAPVVGNYAYWIADEGIKASVSLTSPQATGNTVTHDDSPADNWSGATNAKRSRLDQMQLPRPRLEAVFASADPDATTTATAISRILTPGQLQLIPGAPAAASVRQNFHALTALSEAVLVDKINGRLRRDLSSDLAATNAGAGIRAFRDFRISTPASGFVAEYPPVPITPAGSTGFPSLSAGPVLSEFTLRFWFTLSGSGEVVLNYLVEAELWNPYAARFSMTQTGSPQPLAISMGSLNITINTAAGSTVVDVGALVSNVNGANQGVRVDSSETWEPGEIKIVSGTATLSSGGAIGSLNTGATIPGAVSITTVGLPALPTQPKIELYILPTSGPRALLQAYEPTISRNAQTVTTTNPTSFSFGYGFSYKDNLTFWTFLNQATGLGLDPRVPLLNGAFHAPKWSAASPVSNAGLSADGVLAGQTKIVLIDLPRQELVSVGFLRNAINRFPSPMGNPRRTGFTTPNDYFDRFYFSTIPHNHAWNFAANEPLPNRYVSYRPSGSGAVPTTADLLDEYQPGRYLLQQGAFNVNSTSVAAWKTVLGSRITQWQLEGAAGTQTLDNTFLRLTHGAQQMTRAPLPNAAISTLPISNANAVVTGGRQLTATQVHDLATAIVAALKTRGRPFATLRDFLDSGLIENAIATANINALTSISADFSRAPAGLTQADIAEQIAPFLSPRSDTFTIRSYGDSVNPVTNQVIARAWCELRVQRVPEPLDPAETNPIFPTGVFGRKFKVVSFKWLTSDDL